MQFKKLFVTGGAGFIGAAFVRLVLEENPEIEIVNFDALTYAGNLDNLQGVDESRHTFVRGDITNRDEVFAAMNDVDAVLNFAAESHVDRSIASANEFVLTNVLGTQVLLDAARAKGVRRFLQVSAAEHMVRAAHHTFGLDTVITRCGNNYGPRQFPEKLLPLLISNAQRDQPIPVYGDGRNVRDWIYVDDHARGIWRVLESGKSGDVYCLGARNARRNLEVVKSVLDLLNKPHSLITFVKDRPGHDMRYALDPTKAETELDWKPLETWQSGLQKTLDWYAQNTQWVERARSGEYREYYQQQYGQPAVGSNAVMT
jgi:dTDP-glucose 4,6-dehydratase